MVQFKGLETFLKEPKKLAALVLVPLALLIGFNLYSSSQPRSLVGVVDVSFSGYDGYGVLDYNYDEVGKEVARTSYLAAGFNKQQAEDLVNNDTIVMSEVTTDSKLSAKYTKALAMIGSVTYQFDKTTDLKNGDKVTFVVTTKSSKSPIKKEKKVFTVKELNPVENISKKAFLEEYPVTFKGFNGYGSLELPVDGNDDAIFVEVNESRNRYKNGDKVTLKVSPYYIEELKAEGKKLESNKIEVEVSGLKSIDDIKNVTEALGKNDTYVRSEYKNSSYATYEIASQKSYISYKTSYDYSSDSTGQIYLVTVYKIVKKPEYGDTTVNYVYYGYRYYLTSDNQLELDTANKVYGYQNEDYDNLTADLEVEGYKEYSPAADSSTDEKAS